MIYGSFNDDAADFTAEEAVESDFYSEEDAAAAIRERYSAEDGLVIHLVEEPDEEDEEEDNSEAIEDCYYADADLCSGDLWECQTCHQEYCDFHFHDTSKGHNVECVACERERNEKAK